MLRAVSAALLVLLCCACGGGGDQPPPPPLEPVVWTMGPKAPRHLVLILGRGEPPRPLQAIALDGTLRLRGIMGGTVTLMDAASSEQVGVISADLDGNVRLDQTLLPAGSLMTLHASEGTVTATTVIESIAGRSDRDLQALLP